MVHNKTPMMSYARCDLMVMLFIIGYIMCWNVCERACLYPGLSTCVTVCVV